MKYFALVMSLAYMGVGALILFTNFMLLQISRFRVPLGVILLAYGVVRIIMWQRKQVQSQQESE